MNRNIFKHIFGFRSNKTWKKVVASIYYTLFLLLGTVLLGYSFLLIIGAIALFVVGLINIISNKKQGNSLRKPAITIVIAFIALISGFSVAGNSTTANKEVSKEVSEEKREDKQEVAKEEIKEDVTEDIKASTEEVSTESTEKEETERRKRRIEYDAKNVITELSRTSIKDIQINENFGDKNNKSYIVLLYLSFDAKNSKKTSRKMIEMYNNEIGAQLAKIKDVSEITVFWQVPYLSNNSGNNIAKANLERKGDNMYFNSKWFAPMFN